MFTVADARNLAAVAHAGQVDKQGHDYFLAHLVPIAASLAHLGPEAEMAGLLHDIIEDTAGHAEPYTAARLKDLGVPPYVVDAVVSVSRIPGESYLGGLIPRSAAHPLGREVKLADNAHNLASNPGFALIDPVKAKSLREGRYEPARVILLAARS